MVKFEISSSLTASLPSMRVMKASAPLTFFAATSVAAVAGLACVSARDPRRTARRVTTAPALFFCDDDDGPLATTSSLRSCAAATTPFPRRCVVVLTDDGKPTVIGIIVIVAAMIMIYQLSRVCRVRWRVEHR
jgi:hypothetical protein